MLRWFVRRLSDAQKEEKGFTLIELLVVILIIAILAAIAIPVFLAQRERAWESTAQSDARNAAAAATSCYASQTGAQTYLNQCDTTALLIPFGYNRTAGVTVNGYTASATNWCISTQHTSGGRAALFQTWGGEGIAGQVQTVARGTLCPAAP